MRFIFIILCLIQANSLEAKLSISAPADAYLEKAAAFEAQKNLDSAIVYYLRAAHQFRSDSIWQAGVTAQTKAGNLYFAQRKSEEAIQTFSYLLDSLTSHLNDTTKSELYFKVGLSYARMAQFVDGLENMKQSCEIRASILAPFDPTLAESYHMLGRLYFTIGNYQQSLHYQQQYLKINQHNYAANHMEVSDALHYVGLSYSRLFEHDLALEYYFKSASIVEQAGEAERWALTHIYNNIGLVYGRQGMFEKEQEYIRKALTMKKELGMVYSDSYHNLGKNHIDLKQFDKAQEILHEALQLKMDEIGAWHTSVASTYFYLAELHMKQAQYDSAQNYAEKAMEIDIKNFGENGTYLAFDYKLLATIFQQQEQWDQSLQNTQKAISCLTQNYDTAQLAVNPSPQDQIINHLTLLEVVYQKAETLMKRYESEHNDGDLALAYQTSIAATALIDHIYQNLNDPETRTFLADNANKILELALHTSYELQKQENSTDYLQSAFQIMEKNKAQLLLHNIAASRWKQQAGVADSLLVEEQEIKAALAYFEKLRFEEDHKEDTDSTKINAYLDRIFALHRKEEALNDVLRESYPQYYQMTHHPKLISIEQAQNKLIQDDELLIEYFYGENAVYSFTIDKETFALYRYETSELPVDTMLYGLRNRQFKAYSQSAYQLYESLLSPVIQQYPDKALIIIPDGKLGYIPFEALLTQPADAKSITENNYKSLRYLILDRTVAYQYSANLLASVKEKAQHKYTRTFAGYAPSFSKAQNPLIATRTADNRQLIDELQALPFAREEVESIALLLHGNSHTSTEATEKYFKQTASDNRIIHLASHTLIDDRNPLYSRLVFSTDDDSEEDGLLHTYELYNMQLNAEMVTLSACNTGVGKIQKGEGIISLARGFMYAGVSNVLMSLWAVYDRSTSQLMQNFYAALNEGNSKAAALRTAKIQYLEQADANTAAPYYWSGFVLISNNQDAPENKFKLLYFLLPLIALILAGWYFYRKIRTRTNT